MYKYTKYDKIFNPKHINFCLCKSNAFVAIIIVFIEINEKYWQVIFIAIKYEHKEYKEK